jgi:hypothetical protein
MQIVHPVTAYIAANNMEVYAVRLILTDHGITTQVIEDIGQTDIGFAAMVHQPKIIVDASQLEQAKLILLHYEEKIRRRLEAEEKLANNFNFPIEECMQITCENCQQYITFPKALEGTIQTCPACKLSVDVEIDNE